MGRHIAMNQHSARADDATLAKPNRSDPQTGFLRTTAASAWSWPSTHRCGRTARAVRLTTILLFP